MKPADLRDDPSYHYEPRCAICGEYFKDDDEVDGYFSVKAVLHSTCYARIRAIYDEEERILKEKDEEWLRQNPDWKW